MAKRKHESIKFNKENLKWKKIMGCKFIIGLVIVLISIANVNESNARTNGSEMLQYCTETNNHFQNDQKADMMNVGICLGQVEGILWTLHGLKNFMPKGAQLCMPQNFSNAQAVMTVIKWLNENPEKLHEGADALIAAALINTYNCAK